MVCISSVTAVVSTMDLTDGLTAGILAANLGFGRCGRGIAVG